jgi:multidrug efflux pump subunit AcrB
MYVMLDEFHERAHQGLSAGTISATLQEQLENEVSDAVVNIAGAPPIEGLGTAGGFKIVIEDRGENGLSALQQVSQQIVDEGRQTPGLDKLFTSFRADTTWLLLDIDRDEAQSMGVSMADVFNMLQVNLGTLYINDFNRFGRTCKPMLITACRGTTCRGSTCVALATEWCH